MKKKNLKTLKLNKKSVSNLDNNKIKGGWTSNSCGRSGCLDFTIYTYSNCVSYLDPMLCDFEEFNN